VCMVRGWPEHLTEALMLIKMTLVAIFAAPCTVHFSVSSYGGSSKTAEARNEAVALCGVDTSRVHPNSHWCVRPVRWGWEARISRHVTQSVQR
jgi:hypothetical protein